MKTQASFEKNKTYIKGRVNLNISGSQANTELCQNASFQLHNKFQDGFTKLKVSFHPVQP